MKRTLLVELDVADPGTLPEDAMEIQAILNDAGYTVTSVKPWNSPSDGLPTSAPPI